MRYVALLRGVNVGGNNKVPMAELKEAFAEYGFADVSTYINSGNILFSSDNDNILALQEACETIIANRFGLQIRVAVFSAWEMAEALAAAPAWWGVDADAKHNTIFVRRPVSAEEICARAGEIRPEYERLSHHGNVIFWSAPLATLTRTRWIRLASTPAYSDVTVRNANTMKKLVRLLTEQ